MRGSVLSLKKRAIALVTALTVALAMPSFSMFGYDGGVKVAKATTESISVSDGDFEGDLWNNWSIWFENDANWSSCGASVSSNDGRLGSKGLKITLGVDTNATVTFKNSLTLSAGTYNISVYARENTGGYNFGGQICNGSAKLGTWKSVSDSEYNEFTATLTLDDEASVYLGLAFYANTGAEIYVDDFTITKEVEENSDPDLSAPTGKLAITKINNIEENDIRGIDVSSFESIMQSFEAMGSGSFKDYSGNALTRKTFFEFLKNQGVNWVRLRVWNNPYTSSGKGYGGGNNDLVKAKLMGKYATDAGLRVLIDFHYSDFWADPSKQSEPKSWKNKTVDEKALLVKEYTKSSIQELVNYGVDVGMVQVGNETNGGIAGVWADDFKDQDGNDTPWSGHLDKIFDAGCDAVHEVTNTNAPTGTSQNILAAVHFTDPQTSGKQAGYAANLADYDNGNGVSYDVFATSYYPYWHGSLSNLSSVLSGIAQTYGKKVMVAETSYANTLEDVDGHDNTVRPGVNDTGDDLKWTFTEHGQASEFRDVLNTILNIKDSNDTKAGLGVFYWEGAWIGLANTYNSDGSLNTSKRATNASYWERYGSGWAASYSSEYDPDDAGKWYGGSAVENQCFFGKDGTALDSLSVFSFENLKNGVSVSSDDKKIIGYQSGRKSIDLEETITTRDVSATAIYNTGEQESATVVWDESDIAFVNKKAKTAAGIGTYAVSGVATDGTRVSCIVTVDAQSILKNSSFEEYEKYWTAGESNTSGAGAKSDENNARTGSAYTHCWSDPGGADFSYQFSQKVDVTSAGYYSAYVYAHGQNGTGGIDVYVNDSLVGSSEKDVEGWKSYVTPRVDNINVKVGDKIKVVVKAVGTPTADQGSYVCLDDVMLYKAGYIEPENTSSNPSTGSSGSSSSSSSGSSSPSVYIISETTNNTSTSEGEVSTTTTKYSDGTEVVGEVVTDSETGDVLKTTTSTTSTDAVGNIVTVTTSESADGSKLESTKTEAKDGSSTEISKETLSDGTITDKTATVSVAGVIKESSVSTSPDGSTVEVDQTTKKNGDYTKDSTTTIVNDTGKVENIIIEKETQKSAVITTSTYEVANISKSTVVAIGTKTTAKTQTITIPKTVTANGKTYKVVKIATKAYAKNKKVTKVTVGNNITSVGKSAFKGDTKLKTVTIGSSVKTIGASTFAGDKVLKKITVNSKNITKVGKNAFKGISTSATITIKGTKKQYNKTVKLIKASGISKKVKFKRA